MLTGTQLTHAMPEVDAALRRELAGNPDAAGSALPVVSLTSAEHGPLVVMRAGDLAVILAYLRRTRTIGPSAS